MQFIDSNGILRSSGDFVQDTPITSARRMTWADYEKKHAQGPAPLSHEDFDALAEVDPTPTKKYLNWLIMKVDKLPDEGERHRFIYEDAGMWRDWLDLFNTAIPFLPAGKNDILKFKSVNDFKDFMETNLNPRSTAPEHTALVRAQNKLSTGEDTEEVVETPEEEVPEISPTEGGSGIHQEKDVMVIYEDQTWRIINPLNKAAAVREGTSCEGDADNGYNRGWCTGWLGSDNYYKSYAEGGGKIVIFIYKPWLPKLKARFQAYYVPGNLGSSQNQFHTYKNVSIFSEDNNGVSNSVQLILSIPDAGFNAYKEYTGVDLKTLVKSHYLNQSIFSRGNNPSFQEFVVLMNEGGRLNDSATLRFLGKLSEGKLEDNYNKVLTALIKKPASICNYMALKDMPSSLTLAIFDTVIQLGRVDLLPALGSHLSTGNMDDILLKALTSKDFEGVMSSLFPEDKSWPDSILPTLIGKVTEGKVSDKVARYFLEDHKDDCVKDANPKENKAGQPVSYKDIREAMNLAAVKHRLDLVKVLTDIQPTAIEAGTYKQLLVSPETTADYLKELYDIIKLRPKFISLVNYALEAKRYDLAAVPFAYGTPPFPDKATYPAVYSALYTDMANLIKDGSPQAQEIYNNILEHYPEWFLPWGPESATLYKNIVAGKAEGTFPIKASKDITLSSLVKDLDLDGADITKKLEVFSFRKV